MDKIKIGQITGAVGIKGEVKVYDYGEDPERYRDFSRVIIDDNAYEILQAGTRKNLVVLRLDGISDRNEAEKMRGKDVYISEDELPELPEGTYYIKDLISFDVADENGEKVGVLKDILTSSAQRLYVVETENGDRYVPGVDEYILDIDTDNRVITIKVIEGLLD